MTVVERYIKRMEKIIARLMALPLAPEPEPEPAPLPVAKIVKR